MGYHRGAAQRKVFLRTGDTRNQLNIKLLSYGVRDVVTHIFVHCTFATWGCVWKIAPVAQSVRRSLVASECGEAPTGRGHNAAADRLSTRDNR